MNGAEIDTFKLRLHRFTSKGLSHTSDQALAVRLLRRDRELDDRRVCPECTHLVKGWRCNNWRTASGGFDSRPVPLAAELVLQLQRCEGFIESC
jgi:hypothetical protein